MVADIVQLYGPGMSFYLPKTEKRAIPTTITPEKKQPSLERYSAALLALCSSNQDLETKMSKLRSSTIRLKLDLMKLQRHITTVQHELLPTWQADILTLLISVMYRQRGGNGELPGGFEMAGLEMLDHDSLTKVYTVAAGRIARVNLKRKLGLSAKYHVALRKYCDVAEFRSVNPYQTECVFARWLVSEKEKNARLYEFWGALFPICYRRTVEESAEIAESAEST